MRFRSGGSRRNVRGLDHHRTMVAEKPKKETCPCPPCRLVVVWITIIDQDD
jgi:hypothetical protein